MALDYDPAQASSETSNLNGDRVTADYCSYLRTQLSERLSALGLNEECCHQFGLDWQGHGAMFAGSVLYFRGQDRLVAVAYSPGAGASCLVGEAEADLSTYREWPSLWDLVGMTGRVDDKDVESVGAYLADFPQGADEMFGLIVETLGQLLPRS